MKKLDRTELTALVLLGIILLAFPIGIYSYESNKIARILSYKGTIEVKIQSIDGQIFPDKIVVKKGEKVKLVIYSEDVVHSLIIPELNLDTGPIKPGHIKIFEFIPDKEGSFSIYCGIYCGPHHSHIKGKLIVVR